MAVSDPTTSDAIDAHWALAAAGLSDLVWGHAAIRHPDGTGIVSKSAGWAFEEIDESRIVKVGWDRRLLTGQGRVHIEVPIHTRIMLRRPDVGCVVHVHAPTVAAFAALNVPMRAISHDGAPFVEDLPRFEVTGDLISSDELGDALAETLSDAPAVVIPAHGLVSAGADVASAVMYAVLLERACRIYLLAASAGGPAVWSDLEEVRAKRQTAWAPSQLQAGYQFLVRSGRTMHHRSSYSA